MSTLTSHVSGGLVRGWYLVPQCAIDCFDPLELFPLMLLACEGQLAELKEFGQAIIPNVVCFVWIC